MPNTLTRQGAARVQTAHLAVMEIRCPNHRLALTMVIYVIFIFLFIYLFSSRVIKFIVLQSSESEFPFLFQVCWYLFHSNTQWVEQKSNKHQKHGKDPHSIELVTLEDHLLCLKSCKIKNPMKNFKNPDLLTYFLLYVSMIFDFLMPYKIPYFEGFQTKWIMITYGTYFIAVVLFPMIFNVCQIFAKRTVNIS